MTIMKTILALIAVTALAISVFSIQQVNALSSGEVIDICCTWGDHLIKDDNGNKKIQLTYKISGGTQEMRDRAQLAIDDWNTAMTGELGYSDFLVENTAKGKDGKSDITVKISRGGGPIAGQTLHSYDKGTSFVKSVSINISGKFVGNEVLDTMQEVVAHEVGHALSLGHTPSEQSDDLMSPTVNGVSTIDQCHIDAIVYANAWAFNDPNNSPEHPIIGVEEFTCPP